MNWKNARWELTNMEKMEVSYKIMCQGSRVGPIFLPEQLPARAFMDACQKFTGNIFRIKDEISRNTAINLIEKDGKGCKQCMYS